MVSSVAGDYNIVEIAAGDLLALSANMMYYSFNLLLQSVAALYWWENPALREFAQT